jgi:hypothetical protein
VLEQRKGKALVKWSGYGPEYNEWISENTIKNLYD